MRQLAMATSGEAYEVELTSEASALLFVLPVPIVLLIHKRLREVAEIAAVAGGLGFVVLDGGGGMLRLRVANAVVSYTVSDPRRLLTVTGVAPAGDGVQE